MDKKNAILNHIERVYPGEEVIVLDGFDDAILGFTFDEDFYRIIYSVPKIVESLMESGISFVEAVEYFDFNILGLNLGTRGPIYLHDPTYIPPNERFVLN